MCGGGDRDREDRQSCCRCRAIRGSTTSICSSCSSSRRSSMWLGFRSMSAPPIITGRIHPWHWPLRSISSKRFLVKVWFFFFFCCACACLLVGVWVWYFGVCLYEMILYLTVLCFFVWRIRFWICLIFCFLFFAWNYDLKAVIL